MELKRLTDPEEIALRGRDVVIGGALGGATAIACIIYVLHSPASEHRAFLIGVCLVWGVLSCGLFLLPRRRIAASRQREPFFLAWSAMVVGSIAICIMLEQLQGTPLTIAFILTLILAAI